MSPIEVYGEGACAAATLLFIACGWATGIADASPDERWTDTLIGASFGALAFTLAGWVGLWMVAASSYVHPSSIGAL